MENNREENQFKALIKSTGRETAPEHIARSVLDSLRSESVVTQKNERLIPLWAIAAFAACLFIALANTTSWSMDFLSFFEGYTSPDFIGQLSFPKIALGGTASIALKILIPVLCIQFILIRKYFDLRSN